MVVIVLGCLVHDLSLTNFMKNKPIKREDKLMLTAGTIVTLGMKVTVMTTITQL